MEAKDLDRIIREKEGYVALAFPALMRKVYLWMTLALAITGFTAYVVATTDGLMYAIYSNSILKWGLIIAEFAIVIGVTARIHRLSLTTATLLFILFSVVNGALLSVIFAAYSMVVITKVFLITAGMFGAMSLVGYTTKRDLSAMGRLLYMALIGLIIATVVNLFIKSSGFDMILSYIGVLIFAGLTAWDTQKIKRMLAMADAMDETAQKIALLGALSLYLDFINMFLYLLRIFGRK